VIRLSDKGKMFMKMQPLAIAITVINIALMMFLLVQIQQVEKDRDTSVLRGSALEIVDDLGRVRASIQVLPAGHMPNGEAYFETVIFRLIDPDGRPTVKMTNPEQGSGLLLLGATDTTYTLLGSEGADSSLKLTNENGQEQIIKPEILRAGTTCWR